MFDHNQHNMPLATSIIFPDKLATILKYRFSLLSKDGILKYEGKVARTLCRLALYAIIIRVCVCVCVCACVHARVCVCVCVAVHDDDEDNYVDDYDDDSVCICVCLLV